MPSLYQSEMTRRTTQDPRQVNPWTQLCARPSLLPSLLCCSRSCIHTAPCVQLLSDSPSLSLRSFFLQFSGLHCAPSVLLSLPAPQQLFPFQFVCWVGKRSLAWQSREGDKWCHLWQLFLPFFSMGSGQWGQKGELCIWDQAANPPVPFSALNMGRLRSRRKVAFGAGTGIALNKEVCRFPYMCQSKEPNHSLSRFLSFFLTFYSVFCRFPKWPSFFRYPGWRDGITVWLQVPPIRRVCPLQFIPYRNKPMWTCSQRMCLPT